MAHDRIRFVTTAGNVEMNIDETFDLAQQVTMWRGMGYVMNPTVYLPLSSILGVFTYDSKEAANAEGSNVINIGAAREKLN